MGRILVMPKLGLTMESGMIAKWLKEEGDYVEKGEEIFEVETDKLTNSIEAPESGYLRKILVEENVDTKVTAPVGILAGEDEDITDLLAEAGGEAVEEEIAEKEVEEVKEVKKEAKVEVSIDKTGYIRATPYAKKIARENDVDLSKVEGTGKSGIILAKDVNRYIEESFDEGRAFASPLARRVAEELGVDLLDLDVDGRIMEKHVLEYHKSKVEIDEKPKETVAELKDQGREEIPSGMRRVIAERMQESWLTSPMVNYNMEVDMEAAIDLRKKLNSKYEAEDIKISYNDILIKIVTIALEEFPYMNASYDGEKITRHEEINIGLAVDVGDGLLVPNVKNTKGMGLKEISRKSKEVIKASLDGTISPDDLSGGTFTISNLGMFGMDSFTPIVNQPEMGILGVNRIAKKPIIIDDEIVIKPMMNLSLTADHRLIDGAVGAKFLQRIKELLENPYLLLA